MFCIDKNRTHPKNDILPTVSLIHNNCNETFTKCSSGLWSNDNNFCIKIIIHCFVVMHDFFLWEFQRIFISFFSGRPMLIPIAVEKSFCISSLLFTVCLIYNQVHIQKGLSKRTCMRAEGNFAPRFPVFVRDMTISPLLGQWRKQP